MKSIDDSNVDEDCDDGPAPSRLLELRRTALMLSLIRDCSGIYAVDSSELVRQEVVGEKAVDSECKAWGSTLVYRSLKLSASSFAGPANPIGIKSQRSNPSSGKQSARDALVPSTISSRQLNSCGCAASQTFLLSESVENEHREPFGRKLSLSVWEDRSNRTSATNAFRQIIGTSSMLQVDDESAMVSDFEFSHRRWAAVLLAVSSRRIRW